MLLFSNAMSQVPADAIQAVRNISSFNPFGYYTELVAGSTVIGTPYLDEQWKSADITLTSGHTLPNYAVRYNLAGDFLEIKMLDGVKAIERKNITHLTFKDVSKIRHFVVENGEDSGLYETLADGPWQLLCKYEVTVKPPDYVPQFNVGSRDTHIVTKETLYTRHASQISKLPGRANAFFKLFGSRSDVIQAYVNEHQLSFKDREDVLMIFEHYNTLVSP